MAVKPHASPRRVFNPRLAALARLDRTTLIARWLDEVTPGRPAVMTSHVAGMSREKLIAALLEAGK